MHRIHRHIFKLLLALILPSLLISCVTVKKGGTDLEKASKINVQLGIGYFHRGNLELANEKLIKAMRQDPSSSQAHHAYAVLQNKFLDNEKAEMHFRKAIELDAKNSGALNNFGAFLCAAKRYIEADKMFMQAVDNPLYRSPEIAFTSAAVCVLKQGNDQLAKAKEYLRRALGVSNNYRPALIGMAELSFAEKNYDLARLYIDRFHVTGDASARSLWLAIRNELEMGKKSAIPELAEKLGSTFPDSTEYKLWLALDK